MIKYKLKSLLLAAAMVCALAVLPAAAQTEETAGEYAAGILYELGLFQGVGVNADGTPNFDLGRAPSREEAVTMLVRLLGKDAEAKKGSFSTPFQDVSDWAKPYVGYAYEHKLAYGVSGTSFGGSQSVTASQYLTFVLRALGYNSDTDFEWNAAWEMTNALGITFPGEYDASTTTFTRGDVAIISAAALDGAMKSTGHNLLAFLNASGALADTNLVLFKAEVLGCQENRMEFIFYPISGSPNIYASFQVNSVTVNGQSCTITKQYQTNPEATAASASLKNNYPDTFGYLIVSYDEAAAKKASTDTYSLGGGKDFPILLFEFDCTGTLPNGEKVSEVFSEYVYIDGYGYVQ